MCGSRSCACRTALTVGVQLATAASKPRRSTASPIPSNWAVRRYQINISGRAAYVSGRCVCNQHDWSLRRRALSRRDVAPEQALTRAYNFSALHSRGLMYKRALRQAPKPRHHDVSAGACHSHARTRPCCTADHAVYRQYTAVYRSIPHSSHGIVGLCGILRPPIYR
jgi:hypothetical protein